MCGFAHCLQNQLIIKPTKQEQKLKDAIEGGAFYTAGGI